MVVYHGTTQDRAKCIFECGKILRTNENIRKYLNTDLDYVYVTDNLAVAFDFALRDIKKDEIKTAVVFRIEIDESELLLDEYENSNKSFYIPDVEYCSYKVKRDLVLNDDVVVWTEKPFCFRTMDNAIVDIVNNKKVISDFEWRSLSCDK